MNKYNGLFLRRRLRHWCAEQLVYSTGTLAGLIGLSVSGLLFTPFDLLVLFACVVGIVCQLISIAQAWSHYCLLKVRAPRRRS